MNISRRGFLRSLGAAALGFVVDPASNLLLPELEPRKRIWVVGAQLARPRDDLKVANFSTLYGLPQMHLAASMVLPLRRRLDYSAIGREIFKVESLPAGALPIYEELKWPSRS